jgi:hypothetical protein
LFLQGHAVVGDRIVPSTQLFVDLGPGLDDGGVPRSQRHGLLGVRQAQSVAAQQVIVPGATVVAGGVAGLERNRPRVVGDGFDVETLVFVSDGALVEGVAVMGD